MKLLIAYDGSESADFALQDLSRSGLPETAEALVVVVAEVWLAPPPPSSYEIVEAAKQAQSPDELLDLCGRDSTIIADAEVLANRAVARIEESFPQWTIRTRVRCGSPATEIIKEADEWHPDLVTVGSHGRSALGRLIMGSVSQKLVNYSRSSVRVARGRASSVSSAVKIVIGTEGSPGAEMAVLSVAERHWPAGSEVRLVASTAPFRQNLPPIKITSANLQAMHSKAESQLIAAGLRVSSFIGDVEPKQLLVDEASSWDADCIFVGAKGHPLIDRILLGSVSAAVAARANCSVEVVRPIYV